LLAADTFVAARVGAPMTTDKHACHSPPSGVVVNQHYGTIRAGPGRAVRAVRAIRAGPARRSRLLAVGPSLPSARVHAGQGASPGAPPACPVRSPGARAVPRSGSPNAGRRLESGPSEPRDSDGGDTAGPLGVRACLPADAGRQDPRPLRVNQQYPGPIIPPSPSAIRVPAAPRWDAWAWHGPACLWYY
jgi:hypothetical protein